MKHIIYFSIVFLSVLNLVHAQTINALPDTGNVGIGTTSPSCKLEVNGGSKFVGRVEADSSIIVRDSLRVEGETRMQDVKIDGNLHVSGNLNVNQKIVANEGVSLFTNNGIRYYPGVSGGPSSFKYGNISGSQTNVVPQCAALPSVPVNHQFGGWLQIFQLDPTTLDYSPGTALLNIQSFNNNCSIDASAGGIGGPTAPLLLNYFCGSDTYLNTGPFGGVVGTGRNVEIGAPQRDLNVALNIKAEDKTGLVINSGNAANTLHNAIDVVNIATGKVNFRVKNNGTVYMPEGFVQLTTFPDYVFKSDYKLRSLKEVEDFINENQHLPGVPSEKEVQEEGAINLGKIQLATLEKTEELFLYSIEMKKQIEVLEIENQKLKAEKEKTANLLVELQRRLEQLESKVK